jgi:hypothetical protein
VLLIVSLAAWYGAGAIGRSGTPGPPSPSIGNALNKPVAEGIGTLSLENQEGRRVTLDQFKGRAVFLVPFLTSCQEECPITTAALLTMQRAIDNDNLSRKVAIVEVTVDPGRDTPQRMTAYANLTGSTWPLDWQTHRPYTYDVDHSDGFVLLDTHLHERFIAGGMTAVGRIPANLERLLDSQGKADLRNPGAGTWTTNDALNAVGWVLGRPVATVG